MAFLRVGTFSFGGGSASQLWMRRELVWKHGWLTDGEYNRIWQLTKLTIGIQQIGQVILYSRKLGGRRGIALGVAGFLVPSVTLTIVMSIVLVATIGNRFVNDALRVIVPLTGGLTMAIALQMWSPKRPSVPQDWAGMFLEGLVILASSIAIGALHVPVPLIIVVALTIGALRVR